MNVFYSDEDGCYIADFPDLEFCSASGSMVESAVHEALIAKTLRLKSAEELGKEIPHPRHRPAIYQAIGR